MKDIIEEGGIVSDIVKSFPYEKLVDSRNFVSLLYFFGLLTFTGEQVQGDPALKSRQPSTRALVKAPWPQALFPTLAWRPVEAAMTNTPGLNWDAFYSRVTFLHAPSSSSTSQSKPVIFRSSRLNATPTRYTASPCPRYFST